MAYDSTAWQNFYLMTGGTAAALTGLLLVAMSLHAKTITDNPFYRHRATSTLMSLTTQLILAALVLVPGQSLTALGLEVEIGALLFLGMALWSFAFRGPSTGSAPMSRVRWVTEVVHAGVWNALFVGSGISLLTGSGGGFYLLAIWMLMAFAWSIYVAWILITEVSRQR